jgi:hypothetical protein
MRSIIWMSYLTHGAITQRVCPGVTPTLFPPPPQNACPRCTTTAYICAAQLCGMLLLVYGVSLSNLLGWVAISGISLWVLCKMWVGNDAGLLEA